MRITGVTIEAIDHIRANTAVGNHIEVPKVGEGTTKQL